MLRLVLAAGGVAAALLPAAAMAQPYYDPPTPYPYEQQQSSSAGDYSRDSADNDRDMDDDSDRTGSYTQDWGDRREHFTGRVGAAWRDADGRRCRWREVSRTEADGYAAYKWITVCRD
jgi:hypothetical protein